MGNGFNMKLSTNNNLFNLSDKFILIYGTPLLLWPVSLLNQFSFMEKISLTFLFVVMFIGFELLFRSSITTKTINFKRKKRVIEDLNVSFHLFLTPQVLVTSVIATILGGLIGFYFINHDFFSFISIALMFFIVILGIEFFFQDLVISAFLKGHVDKQHKSLLIVRNKKIGFVDIIEYISFYVPLIGFIYNNPTVIFYTVLGFILTYKFYAQDLFSLVFGTAVFIILGFGINSLKRY
ncbi:hypothetical protein DID74_00535 [Candidatus Marinamargulisbacteria bacterium SCGC AG-333-B06]|nr:hypothetical protein DID74_00535 [Candidatus Marinamargulisbacteria bacterium SCGC AG-333-B06]